MIRKLSPLVLIAVLIGCGGPKTEPVPAPTQPAVTLPKPAPKPAVLIPENLMTEGLAYLGAPFDKPLWYEIQGIGEQKLVGAPTMKVSLAKDKVIVAVDWTDELARLENDRYVCDKAGVRANVAQGHILNPPFAYLPAKLTPGLKWKAYSEFVAAEGIRYKLSFNCKIVGIQKVTVPLGTFDAVMVTQEGTVNWSTNKGKQQVSYWFVKGLGMVKSTTSFNNLSTKNVSSMTVVAIPPKV